MKKIVQSMFYISLAIVTSACTVIGKSSVAIAPYTIINNEGAFEVRNYPKLILVSTPMQGMDDQSQPFRKLFNYIDGKNQQAKEIPMTAPVFLEQNNQISETMSFILPADYELAPAANDPSISIKPITDYTVATVRFNGRLKQDRIEKYKKLLEQWIEDNNYKVVGSAQAAGYNAPFTLPAYRRNEILIPINPL